MMDLVCEIRLAGSTLAGGFADQLLVGSVVDAVNLILSHIAVNPRNFRTEIAHNAAGFLKDGLKPLSSEWARPAILVQ